MAATFVVEDGSGKSDANAYVSVADADQYNEDHNADTTWDGLSDAEKEKYIRLATQYLDMKYGRRWIGVRSNEDQALDWPRTGAVDRDGYTLDSDALPQDLVDACVESAIKYAGGEDLLGDLDNPGIVKKTRSKVGELEDEIEYMGGNTPYKRYRVIEAIIASITSGTNTLERS